MTSASRITRVLVANRGEIALRIIRTLNEMGIESIAVYSEADALSPHVSAATYAVCIGPPDASQSYLNVERILEVAADGGADALHPGYGLLSENADFAEAVEARGLNWIGPSPAAMRVMSSKIDARAAMESAGVAVVPGGDVTQFEAIGFPLLVKASAGGGGKGMRRVDEPSELNDALAACRREAENAFSDGHVYLERLIERPRHVEIQVLGDAHGNVVHLFERECSVQRRHQKVVEESPSVAVNPELRAQMGAAAVAAAKAVSYTGAGTVEFLLDADGGYYFLEMNTRLQVEHPITEMVVGVDLVAEQIRVAQGEALRFSQADLSQSGHAIECRIYAEDPETYLPQTGTISMLQVPEGPGIRHDSGVTVGVEVGIYYDPMLSKLCAWAPTREEAVEHMSRALGQYVLTGVRSNLALLQHIISHDDFKSGDTTTAFLDDHPFIPEDRAPDLVYALCALRDRTMASDRRKNQTEATEDGSDLHSPWDHLGGWRL